MMAYYPLHFVISCLFAPMFIQVERLGKKRPHVLAAGTCAPCGWGSRRWYNTPWTTTAFRAFLNFSMLQAAVQLQSSAGKRRSPFGQAWFPKEAEIWNQPTWFRAQQRGQQVS